MRKRRAAQQQEMVVEVNSSVANTTAAAVGADDGDDDGGATDVPFGRPPLGLTATACGRRRSRRRWCGGVVVVMVWRIRYDCGKAAAGAAVMWWVDS